MSRAVALALALALIACGPPFTMAEAIDDAGTDSATITVDDANTTTALVEVHDGAPSLDASTSTAADVSERREAAAILEAAPGPVSEAAPPSPDVCVPIAPFTLITPYCPAICGQCAGQNAPEYIWQVTPTFCQGIATPAACQACGMYTCACVLANLGHVCSGGAPTSCIEATGMPSVICP